MFIETLIENLYSKFIIELKEYVFIVYNDSQFEWLSCHNEEIDRIKELIWKSTKLEHFNENVSYLIQCEASQYDVGACLMQNNKPIPLSSRSLIVRSGLRRLKRITTFMSEMYKKKTSSSN